MGVIKVLLLKKAIYQKEKIFYFIKEYYWKAKDGKYHITNVYDIEGMLYIV